MTCVCVQNSLRTRGDTESEQIESQDGGVCVFSHTLFFSILVSLVSSNLVLEWYYYCQDSDSSSTRFSTILQVNHE